jgi:cell division topological specificity factor
MNLIDRYFRTSERTSGATAFTAKKGGTASVAKERLKILVAHDRIARDRPSYLPNLEREILEVIRKYVDVDNNAISVRYEQAASQEILELNIILPENTF